MYFFVTSKIVKNTDTIVFLSSDETQAILNNDADHYYQTFNKVDLKLRKSKNVHDYLAKIANSGCEGKEENKEKIIDCIEKVQRKLEPMRNDTIEGVHIDKFLNLPWRIGFICDKVYENGLPHTRGDVIIFNNVDVQRHNIVETCRLLIHEKVHVYQKTYTEEFRKNIQNEYQKIDEMRDNNTSPSNPDVDDYVYKRKSDGQLMRSDYKNKPSSFRDISFPKNDHKLEHPNETTAYSLQELYQ
jgi:hypothetical protein